MSGLPPGRRTGDVVQEKIVAPTARLGRKPAPIPSGRARWGAQRRAPAARRPPIGIPCPDGPVRGPCASSLWRRARPATDPTHHVQTARSSPSLRALGRGTPVAGWARATTRNRYWSPPPRGFQPSRPAGTGLSSRRGHSAHFKQLETVILHRRSSVLTARGLRSFAVFWLEQKLIYLKCSF